MDLFAVLIAVAGIAIGGVVEVISRLTRARPLRRRVEVEVNATGDTLALTAVRAEDVEALLAWMAGREAADIALEARIERRYTTFVNSAPASVARWKAFADRNAGRGGLFRPAVRFATVWTRWWQPEAAVAEAVGALATTSAALAAASDQAAARG